MDGTKIAAGGASGGGVGVAAVYIADRFGAHLNAEDGALITIVAGAVFASVAHNGIVGSLRLLWRGGLQAATTAPDAPPEAQPAPAEPEPTA